jgi:subfamily B ATP-binding cassette protein MsbA
MLDKILGKDIATYVKAHRGLIILAIILSAMSSLFILIPAYLLKPLVDEGMNRASDPVNWTIPWLTFHYPLSFKKTELTIVEGISPNHLLILLAGIAFISVIFKSITRYLRKSSSHYP